VYQLLAAHHTGILSPAEPSHTKEKPDAAAAAAVAVVIRHAHCIVTSAVLLSAYMQTVEVDYFITWPAERCCLPNRTRRDRMTRKSHG